MKKLWKKAAAALLAFALCAGLLPTGALASGSIGVGKTATNLDGKHRSEVTLSVLADDTPRSMDVVFVLDGSTSSDQSELAGAASGLLSTLAAFQNLSISAGVVIFGGNDPILENTGLKDLSDDEQIQILQSVLTDDKYDGMTGRSGSNLQAGIEAARAALEKGSGSEKIMLLLTDGGARMWINDEGQAVAQMPYLYCWNTNEDFRYRYVDGNLELRTFDDVMAAAAAGAEIGRYAINEEQSKDTANIVKNLDPDMDVNTSLDYYSNLEAATFFAAQSVISADSAGISVIWVDYPYNGGTKYGDYTDSFKSWLSGNGYVTRFDSTQSTADELFGSVCDELIPTVSAGSSVVDVIGSGEDYDFAFVNELGALSLTYGGTELAAAAIAGEESAYGFGTYDAAAGTYPFELRYYPDGTTWQGTKYDECFVLEINTPVTTDAPISLTYSVELTDPKLAAGTYGQYDEDGSEGYAGLYTNNSAVLFPVDGKGAALDPVDFPKPTVSYTVEEKIVEVCLAPITIYVGGNGYESVITNQSGSSVAEISDGLPEPGFTIELPEEIDSELKAAVGAEPDETLDLSEYLTFVYDDGEGTTRSWSLERYDNKPGNSSMAEGRYIYRIVPAAGQDPIRLEFEDEDGSLTVSDQFTVQLEDLYQEYEMRLYAGALSGNFVKAVVAIPGNEVRCRIEAVPAALTIRGVTIDGDPTTEIVTQTPAEAVENITAQVPDDTKFYINESTLEVANWDAVRLLVDELVEDSSLTLRADAVESYSEITREHNVMFRYLDLVDTSNGNVYVTASDPIGLYWPYPEGTDENTEFYIVHYKGLDRNDDDALENGDYTMEFFSAENGKLENTAQGIRLEVDSFSPFALFWREEDKADDGSMSGENSAGSESAPSAVTEAPQTGDSAQPLALASLAALAACSVLCVCAASGRRKRG